METHGSFIKNFDDVKVAKAIAKELGISGNAASVDKTVNINFKVKGIEDLQLANKEAETLEAMLSNSRGKYLFSNQNNALKEVARNLQIYNKEIVKTTQAAKNNAEAAAKSVLRWINAYKAHGGKESDLSEELMSVANIWRKDYLPNWDSDNYNYSETKLAESLKYIKELSASGKDLSSVMIKEFKMTEKEAMATAKALGYVVDETVKLSKLKNEIADLYDNKNVWVSPGKNDSATDEDYKKFKKLVDEYRELGGKLEDIQVKAGKASSSSGDKILERYSSISGETSAIKQQEELKQATDGAIQAIKEQQTISQKAIGQKEIIETIKSYEDLKQVLEEIYEIDNKIQKHTYSLEDNKYGDLDAIQKYSDITYEEYNDPFKLQDRIEELLKFYKRVEKATNNPSEQGYAKNKDGEQELFEKDDLKKIEYALGSAFQQWADMGLELEDLSIKMTKKIKEFAQDAIDDWNNNQENDRLYEEEEKTLKQANKDLIARREELTKLIYKGLADSNGEIPLKKELKARDVVHESYDIQNNWKAPINVTYALERLADLLGIEIPQASDKAKNSIEEVNNASKENSSSNPEIVKNQQEDIAHASVEAANVQQESQAEIQASTEKTISKQEELLQLIKEIEALRSSSGIKFDNESINDIRSKQQKKLKEIKTWDIDQLEDHLFNASSEIEKFPEDFSKLNKNQAIKISNIRNMFMALKDLRNGRLSDQDIIDVGFDGETLEKIINYYEKLQAIIDKTTESLLIMKDIPKDELDGISDQLDSKQKKDTKKSSSSKSKQDAKDAKEAAEAEKEKKEVQAQDVPQNSSAENQSKKEEQAAERTTKAEKEKKKTQAQDVPISSSAEEKSKREEQAAENALEAEKKLNQEQKKSKSQTSENTSDYDKKPSIIERIKSALTGSKRKTANYVNEEASYLDELIEKLASVVSAVDKKTEAFERERVAVERIVGDEINKLVELIEQIKKVEQALDNLGNKPVDLDQTALDAVSKLKEQLDGDWAGNVRELFNFIDGLSLSKATADNMQRLANSILTLKSNLNNLSDGGSNFLSSINELITKTEGLKDLATVLRATKEEIENAKRGYDPVKSIVDDDYFTTNVDQMRDSAVKELTGKYSDVRMVEISRSEEGIVTLTAAIKDADGAWKKFVGNINSEGVLSTRGITELAKSKVKDIEMGAVSSKKTDKSYADILKNAMNVEKEYQRLVALQESGVATSAELKRLEELITKREEYNNLIQANKDLIGDLDYKEYEDLRNKQYVKDAQKIEIGNIDIESFKNASNEIQRAEEAFMTLKNRGINGLDSEIEEARQKLNDLNIEFARGNKSADQYEKAVQKILKPFKNVQAVLGKNMTDTQGKLAATNYMQNYVQQMGGKNLDIKFSQVDSKGLMKISGTFLDANKNASKLVTTLNLVDGKLSQVIVTGQKGTALNKIFSSWKEGLANAARYLSTFVGFYEIINVVKQGAKTVIEFDTALTEMRKVSDETVGSLKNFQAESFGMADSVGTTALQIQQSTADFMRLGESLDEAGESAQVANKLMNVSEFDSIEDATTALIAMKAAYDDVDQNVIVDKLNQIGNNFAISTDGLASALQDSASALKTAGSDIDESIALITAGNAVTQDPEKVGAGIRTIALRLTGTKEAKEQLSELGEDTEGVITTTSKLRDTILSATKVESNDFKGFDILDDNGNYKDTYEINKIVSLQSNL